jgi:cyclophilin family peptidyl-prolyl cis-trans isomerase
MIRFETTMGNLDIELLADDAPISVENFLQYVRSGFFTDTVFHRVIPGFVVQGGGLLADMQNKQTEQPIQNEADNGLKNLRGSLSMARTSDPDSATSQFFINLVDNAFLDKNPGSDGYAVFARVVVGMDVVDEMAKVSTGRNGMHDDVPVEPITVTSAQEID